MELREFTDFRSLRAGTYRFRAKFGSHTMVHVAFIAHIVS